LRMMAAGRAPGGLSGEVGACSYTPDSSFVLSGGFDGKLHLWEASQGTHITDFQASSKPVAACAVSPDGVSLVSGSLDGIVSLWDAVSHRQTITFMASPRPISSLVFSDDGRYLATTSWDGSLSVWHSLRDQQYWRLSGHRDIVAGCSFTPDARQIVSWSHDGTVRLWELPHGTPAQEFLGHGDRVISGAVSHDGRLAATGSRDGVLMLWDLQAAQNLSLASLHAEVRGCRFLADGSLLAVDQDGRITLHQVPSLHQLQELQARMAVECCALAPNSRQLALGGADGQVRLVSVEGMEGVPLAVSATQVTRRTATTMQKLLGRSTVTHRYHCTCPACRQEMPLKSGATGSTASCPHCKQKVRVSGVSRVVRE
jgi:WD40 repeat protein